tara:strand:- start:414 stop:1418 length:1005 start_codon:yes stop_codon:yes gene_type:complete
MVKKYFFFRTDRIGDFIFSSILIRSIKDNDKKAIVTVVASKKNYEYIKKQNYIDNVILYPDNPILKIFFLIKLKKQNIHFIAALDGKKRSIYASLLVKAKFKFLVTTKIFYVKIFKNKFTKIISDIDGQPKINEIYKILDVLNFKFNKKHLNFVNKKIKVIPATYNLLKKIKKNYINLHLDEKWINDLYINKYEDIEPNIYAFLDFIEKIVKKTNKNVLITTGCINIKLITSLKNNFSSINSRFFQKKISGKLIILADKLHFLELEYFIQQSSLLISCHGAPTHLAASFNKKIIDIYDKSQSKFYIKWNSHFSEYKSLYRDDFNKLSTKIIKYL